MVLAPNSVLEKNPVSHAIAAFRGHVKTPTQALDIKRVYMLHM